MRFIVDESTGVAVVMYLRAEGHDVLSVAEDMPQAQDDDILARAVEENRVLLTNDKDFGELAFRKGRQHRGIVLLRLGDDSADNRIRMTRLVLEQHLDQLPNHFVAVTDNGIRIRRA
ncbi:MAG: DUF5615 family PIN-like protein [Anaerolineae bacterium]